MSLLMLKTRTVCTSLNLFWILYNPQSAHTVSTHIWLSVPQRVVPGPGAFGWHQQASDRILHT